MTGRVLGYLLAICIMGGVLYGAAQKASAQPQKLFIVGQRYGVLYSCLPQVGCYSEIVTVREVRQDGWLVVTTEDKKRWYLNISQIVSFAPLKEAVS